MDAGVWVGAIFGLGGTVAGGALSIWATMIAQRQQARAARELVISQRLDTAADSAIQMFFQIKQHVRGRPSEFREGARDRIQLWQKALQQQVNKLEPVLVRIRDEALRLRLSKTAEFLAWSETSEPGLGGSAGIYTDLCDHALECLGAFVREEPIPPEGVGLIRASEVEARYNEYMEDLARDHERGYQ